MTERTLSRQDKVKMYETALKGAGEVMRVQIEASVRQITLYISNILTELGLDGKVRNKQGIKQGIIGNMRVYTKSGRFFIEFSKWNVDKRYSPERPYLEYSHCIEVVPESPEDAIATLQENYERADEG